VAKSKAPKTELGADQLTVFVADDDTRATVQAAAQEHWPTATIHDGGLPAALGMLSQDASSPLLVIDVSGSDDPVGALNSLQTLCEDSTRIVLLGDRNDVTLYRDLTNSGAADYLVKPITGDQLVTALRGAQRAPRESSEPDAKALRVIAVVGARGGAGASTVAVNTAWIMANELNHTVALIDLDLQFGTVTLSLDLEPSHGLREAFEKPDRIDGLFIASAMAHESERLFVLGSEEGLDRGVDVKPEAFDVLLDALPDDFDCAVVDLPARLAVARPEWLARADMVAVVSDLSLAGMRDTMRIAHLAREIAPDTALTIIANKVAGAKSGELPKAEFQRGTELPVKHFLPADLKLASAAANAGKPFPLVGKRSALVKELRRAAEVLSGGRPAASETTGGLGKLFKRGK
jgi:pilus assembly protein CpaE